MKTHISNYVRAFSFMAILAINGNCTNQSGSKAAPGYQQQYGRPYRPGQIATMDHCQ